MASHPVHGMLEQETRAGAVSAATKTQSLNLKTTPGSNPAVENNLISVEDSAGSVTDFIGYAQQKLTGFFMRMMYVGGNPYQTSTDFSPTTMYFKCDSNYTDVGPYVSHYILGLSYGFASFYDAKIMSYDTEIGAKNYVSLGWNAAKDLVEFEVGFTSTGAQRDLAFCADNAVAKWKIAYSSGSHFLPAVDNSVNIGSPTNRPAQLFMAPSTTAHAQITLGTGVAPTTPNNGDIWFDGTNLKIQIGGATKTFTVT